MKIEQAIKQSRFRNDKQKLLINILFTSNWLMSEQKTFFGQYDITPQQYNVLRILKGQFPNSISTSNIKDRMIDKNSDTSRIVDRLHLKGWVDKAISATDRRLVDVKISDKGIELLNAIEHEVESLDNLLQKLSDDEIVILNDLLDKLRS